MTVLYVCTDATGFGHVSLRWADRSHTLTPSDTYIEPAEGETDSDTAARIAREQEAEAEAKKAERRELIARNKHSMPRVTVISLSPGSWPGVPVDDPSLSYEPDLQGNFSQYPKFREQ